MRTKIFLIFILTVLLLGGCIQQEERAVDENAGAEEDLNAEQLAEPRCELPAEEQKFIDARNAMVDWQLKKRGIKDAQVLQAMLTVQRHGFVLLRHLDEAYNDWPLPIGYGQTISQPYVVALMSEALEIEKGEKVLEIGTGSGYQAAVLAELGAETYSIEIIEKLAEKSQETLKQNCFDVKVLNADGYFGWEEHAPFDKIIVTAAATHVPQPLIEQLKDGGMLVIPLGSTLYHQTLTLIKKRGSELETEYITGVRFVPMTGEMQRQ